MSALPQKRPPGRRVPLARPSFGAEEERLLIEVLRSGWVTQGPRVAESEERFAVAVDDEHAVAVSSGSAALFLSLRSLGIGQGDEVIVPSLTFIASVNAIVLAGASPLLVDVERSTYNLDPEAVAAAVTPRTRAVMVVHQLGLPADLEALESVAEAHGLAVVEDSACAVGARYRGRPIGPSSTTGCFSFHPRKVLVTGEGGMITTPDGDLAARLRRLRHQGMAVSDLERHEAQHVIIERYPEVGYNFRLSDLHAALGLAQLQRLDSLIAARRAVAERYDAALAELEGVAARACPANAQPNHQSYIVRLCGADRATRDRVLDALDQRGVATRRGLMATHLEEPYRKASRGESLEESERADAETFLLPMFAGLSEDDLDHVVDSLREVLAEVPLE